MNMNTIPSLSVSTNPESGNGNYTAKKFVSKVISLKQTNPRKIDYTIYVKIRINNPCKNAETQQVFFAYKPDKESLQSVIAELIDALQLNKHIHHKIIVNSIENAMKTQQMKIVPSPTTNGNTQTNFDISNNNTNTSDMGMDADEFKFLPLSPLVLSPRTMNRRDSNAKFPNLRSDSMSESDLFLLTNRKQIKYSEHKTKHNSDDLYDYSDSNINNRLIMNEPLSD